MILGSKENQTELMAFIPSIKANMAEWQIVSVRLPVRGKEKLDAVVKKLLTIYEEKEGLIFPVSDYKAVMVIRLGIINNYAILKTDIENKLPKHDTRVIARKMNLEGLKQIQLDISPKPEGGKISFYQEREQRKENVFLIAEDDVFIREMLSDALNDYGDVHEIGDGLQVADEYIRCNPDILILDIHLPGRNGLEIVNNIMEMDTDAFIIIVSADTVRENVIEAVSGGAAGFLAKPIKKERLIEYLDQCITFRVKN